MSNRPNRLKVFSHLFQSCILFWAGLYNNLGGGFKDFSFLPLGEMIQFDLRIFFKWVVQPPATILQGIETQIDMFTKLGGWHSASQSLRDARWDARQRGRFLCCDCRVVKK